MANKYKGKTFAQIADMLQKESASRPNDPVSKRTLDEMMSRLMNAQEEYNMLKEQRKLAKMVDNMSTEEKAMLMSSLAQPMAQEQEGIDLGQPMYAKGGKIYIKPKNRGKFTALKKRTGKSASWFKAHGTPAQKKMATFALNARKWKHEDGGHLAQNGLQLDKYYPTGYGIDYFDGEVFPMNTINIPEGDTSILQYEVPQVENPYDINWGDLAKKEVAKNRAQQDLDLALTMQSVLAPRKIATVGDYQAQLKPGFSAPLLVKDPKAPLGVKVTPKSDTNIDRSTNEGFNGSMLRYAPVVGSAVAALQAALQDKDFTLANQYRDIASQYKPIAAPHIGDYRRYNLYDINLGDAENIALTAKAIEANRGQNRATQGALNAAIIANAQKTAAQRNLAAQQANEANRLATDTYNLGIDQFNAQRDTQYDQLNQQILTNKLHTLMAAANAEDASKQAWANAYNSTVENFWNQLGNVGRDEWNRGQLIMLLDELGAEGLKEYIKNGGKIGQL